MIVIGGIVNSQIAGKRCERDAELENLFAIARKTIKNKKRNM